MFLPRACSAIHFIRSTAFFNFAPKPWSVVYMSITKRSWSDAKSYFEKKIKVAGAKNNNEEECEKSNLYPDELESSSAYDVINNFNFIKGDDILTPSKEEHSKANELKSFQNVKEKEIVFQKKEMKKEEALELAEKFSDSESESDNEIENEIEIENEYENESENESENEIQFRREKKSRKMFQGVDVGNLKIIELPKKSRILSSKLGVTKIKKDKKFLIDTIRGIFALARKGIVPESLFFNNPEILSLFPSSLENTALYKASYYDLLYWGQSRGNSLALALYKQKNSRVATPEPNIPLTVVCCGIKQSFSFSSIMYATSLTSAKVFLSTKDCPDPWDSNVLRKTILAPLYMDHYGNLTWSEVEEKIDENTQIFVLDKQAIRPTSRATRRDEEDFNFLDNIPTVDLYTDKYWARENVTVIALGDNFQKVPYREDMSIFLQEREAFKICFNLNERISRIIMFNMVIFEIRRQWLMRNNKK